MERVREYVSVKAVFEQEGRVSPIEIYWDDGRVFVIDKVLDIRPAASLKVGGAGLCYTCRIGSQTAYLFLDNGRWFVEKKVFTAQKKVDEGILPSNGC